jgi:5-methylcytosine-specific restriction endonuclease McrA
MARLDIKSKETEIRQWIALGKSKAYICRELNCKQDTLNNHLCQFGINYRGSLHGKHNSVKYKHPLSDYLKRNGRIINSHRLKLRLIKEGLKEEKCEECNLRKWRRKKITLHLHHINGNHHDNRLENLKIDCPNCHSQEVL